MQHLEKSEIICMKIARNWHHLQKGMSCLHMHAVWCLIKFHCRIIFSIFIFIREPKAEWDTVDYDDNPHFSSSMLNLIDNFLIFKNFLNDIVCNSNLQFSESPGIEMANFLAQAWRPFPRALPLPASGPKRSWSLEQKICRKSCRTRMFSSTFSPISWPRYPIANKIRNKFKCFDIAQNNDIFLKKEYSGCHDRIHLVALWWIIWIRWNS